MSKTTAGIRQAMPKVYIAPCARSLFCCQLYALSPADPFSDPDMTRDRPNEDPFARVATITVAIVGVGGAAVAGTAFALYKEVRGYHILPI